MFICSQWICYRLGCPCIQKLVDKKLKLVNVVQVMLIRRILPCQERAFNFWEFDPAQHQTLSRLFDTTYEDAWKVLFKGADAPASATKDRGFSLQRPAGEVSYFTLYGTLVLDVHMFSMDLL